MNNLIIECKEIIENNLESYDNASDFFDDLSQNGCQSGMVSELIWYSDTVAFYERHESDISEMLSDMLDSYGLNSPDELFGDNWDKTDPLAVEDLNRNLLAWFAFEEVCYRLADEY